jgi:hypothetical protein
MRALVMVSALVSAVASAQDPATPAAPAPVEAAAPVAPAGAVGVVIANSKSGFTSLDKKAMSAMFRGLLQTTESGDRIVLYTLPPGDPAQLAVLEGTVGWNETTFERQAPIVESQLGRIFFKRQTHGTEVLKAVLADPGGVGVVGGDLALAPGVVVIWPPSP